MSSSHKRRLSGDGSGREDSNTRVNGDDRPSKRHREVEAATPEEGEVEEGMVDGKELGETFTPDATPAPSTETFSKIPMPFKPKQREPSPERFPDRRGDDRRRLRDWERDDRDRDYNPYYGRDRYHDSWRPSPPRLFSHTNDAYDRYVPEEGEERDDHGRDRDYYYESRDRDRGRDRDSYHDSDHYSSRERPYSYGGGRRSRSHSRSRSGGSSSPHSHHSRRATHRLPRHKTPSPAHQAQHYTPTDLSTSRSYMNATRSRSPLRTPTQEVLKPHAPLHFSLPAKPVTAAPRPILNTSSVLDASPQAKVERSPAPPPQPANARSSTSSTPAMPLPPPPPVTHASGAPTSATKSPTSTPPQPPSQQPPKAPPKRRRSESAERAAYGRKFVGCEQLSDFELLDKLGEGTFGYTISHRPSFALHY
jgi:hypothetical protein